MNADQQPGAWVPDPNWTHPAETGDTIREELEEAGLPEDRIRRILEHIEEAVENRAFEEGARLAAGLLEKLPRDLQRAAIGAVGCGESLRDEAARLGVSHTTVRNRRMKAMRAMKAPGVSSGFHSPQR